MREISVFHDVQKYERNKNENFNSAKTLIFVKMYKFLTK